MAINWVLYVRVVQLIFAIIVLGLTAYGKFRSSCIPTHSLYLQARPFFLMTNVSIYIVANQYNSTFYYDGGYYSHSNASPSQVNFLIFCAIWSILAVAFLTLSPRYDTQARHIGHKFAILAVDAVTAIFWFAGFIALAVFIGVPDCGSDTVCGSLQASVAFGAFLW